MSSYANSGRRAMDAATFLKGKASPLGVEGVTPKQGTSRASEVVEVEAAPLVGGGDPSPLPSTPSGASEPVSEQSPPLIFKDTTPSGIVVEYQSQPKRLYRVNGVECPSVTTVLGSLNKPGLSYWGNKIGVDGVLELVRRGLLFQAVDWHND